MLCTAHWFHCATKKDYRASDARGPSKVLQSLALHLRSWGIHTIQSRVYNSPTELTDMHFRFGHEQLASWKCWATSSVGQTPCCSNISFMRVIVNYYATLRQAFLEASTTAKSV